MNKYFIHIAYLCLTLFLLVSCSKQEDVAPQDEGMVNLSISAAMASRTTYTGDVNRTYAELMHTLRIIIFDKDGNVEHNRLYNFEKGLFETENHIFIVKANETKTIYLLANCENFAVKEGDNPTIESLDALELKGDGILQAQGTKPDEGDGTINVLPATAKYSIQVGNQSQTETLYVVHAANKIEFEFINNSGEEVTISEWRLTPIAQNSYLIPHITDEDENTQEEDRWYSKVLAQYNYAGLSGDDEGVTNYNIPIDADQKEFQQTCNVVIDANSSATLYSLANPFYFHESKANPDPSNPNDAEQQYTLSCVINDIVYDAPLPNLPSLFRGTYVKVKATIQKLTTPEEDHDPFGIIIEWEPGDEVEGILTPEDE